jgi:hypothetical protein
VKICDKCGRQCGQFNARYLNRGLCKFCNESHTFLPDGTVVTWQEFKDYFKREREEFKKQQTID